VASIPLIIGHRGAPRGAPENTLASFQLAWQEGADGIETDLRLTRDGQIVALHDATTLRTTGVNLAVAATTLARLSQLPGESRLHGGEGHPGIPTLAALLQALPPGKRLYLELKSGAEIIPPLAQSLAQLAPPPEQIRILAFNADLLRAVKAALPRFRTCWLTDFHLSALPGQQNSPPGQILQTLAACAADGLAGKAGPLITGELASALRRAEKELHVWTVDSVRTGRSLAALGVDSLITNRPGWLRDRLEEGS
jgi:glycerophosphoryl diester phosphodiesterase